MVAGTEEGVGVSQHLERRNGGFLKNLSHSTLFTAFFGVLTSSDILIAELFVLYRCTIVFSDSQPILASSYSNGMYVRGVCILSNHTLLETQHS